MWKLSSWSVSIDKLPSTIQVPRYRCFDQVTTVRLARGSLEKLNSPYQRASQESRWLTSEMNLQLINNYNYNMHILETIYWNVAVYLFPTVVPFPTD